MTETDADKKSALKDRGTPKTLVPLGLAGYDKCQENYEEANLAVELAKRQTDPEKKKAALQQARKAQKKAEADLKKYTVNYEFAALDPEAYERLLDDNPPTEEDKKENPNVSWNGVFLEKLIAACSYSPKFTYEEWVEDVRPNLNAGEQATIIEKVWEINSRAVARNIPKDWTQILNTALKQK